MKKTKKSLSEQTKEEKEKALKKMNRDKEFRKLNSVTRGDVEVLELKENRTKVLKKIEEIKQTFHDKLDLSQKKDCIDEISIKSLHDYKAVEDRTKEDYVLRILNERGNLKKEQAKQIDEFNTLNSEIVIKFIDNLLNRIKDLSEKVEN